MQPVVEPHAARTHVNHLDTLIAALKSSGGGDYDLLIEHLQTAHAYYAGAMPAECAHNLTMAREILTSLPPRPLHRDLLDTIAGMMQELKIYQHEGRRPASGHQANAPGLTAFFHGSDVSFGIFYPKKHVVAVFPSLAVAREGREILVRHGFRLWEVTAVSGAEVEQFLEELRLNRSLWDELVNEVSRLLDTETCLVERYENWARRGAGFLIAHSSTDADAEQIAEALLPLDPTAMHWFMPGYIRHLMATG